MHGEREPSDAVIDHRLWGKREGLPLPYPVICHLIDTAAVAGALWDIWGKGIPSIKIEDFRKYVCFWAGLHDLGKISPSFQVKVTELYRELIDESPRYGLDSPVQGLGHHEVTHWVLVEILRGLGYPQGAGARRDVGHQIAQMLGGHHGRFCQAMDRLELRDPHAARGGLGEGVWKGQRQAHVAVLQKLTEADEALVERLPTWVAVIVIGIVIVADWLVSQESFISPRIPGAGWTPSDEALRAHWERAIADAPSVIREAGLGRARFRDLGFTELFGFEPNALQKSIIDELPALVRGPGLLLVTAPPGDGKTEVALFASKTVAQASGAGGLGLCLPTMATTDAMHRRVKAFAAKALQSDAALTRVHSMAWLSLDAPGEAACSAATASQVVTDREASVEAARWLHAARRGLLAPLSTFTIDQGLAGVLPVKYNVLRLLALSGKVLVIDEAHSYDAWMHALLVRLLEWLGAMDTSVIVLSATLTGASARSLVDAYLHGAGHEKAAEAIQPSYPGWLFADVATGEVSAPRSVPSERERDLDFDVLPVRRGDDENHPEHRLSVIKRLLRPIVDEDLGCVLVCCTTVAEAQSTWAMLTTWFHELQESGRRVPQLRLLHSRYRTADRANVIDGCERDFGKHGSRPRTVLVSTQIIEQSLDLDFDLLITDLAPMALLLQRSGRCQRHRNKESDPHQSRRPGWVSGNPRVIVLDPVDQNGVFTVPQEWGEVYDGSLLHRTSTLLHARAGAPIGIPGSVQELVDAVYSADFTSAFPLDDTTATRIRRADEEMRAEDIVHRQLAGIVAVLPPRDEKLRDLRKLSETSVVVDESMIATRLGADSAQLVCVYAQDSGRWTLDEEGVTDAPGLNGETKVTPQQARLIAQQMIPVPGRWLRTGARLLDLPPAWSKNSVLRGWVLLPMHRMADGHWRGRLCPGEVRYRADAGICL